MMCTRSGNRCRVFVLFSLLVLTTGVCRCGSNDQRISLADFEASNLIGIWEAHYSFVAGTEVLVFKEDGTYQQIYDDSNGCLYVSPWNEWDIERRTDGRVWIHLKGGRWFPHGPEFAELEGMDPVMSGEVHYFFDHVTNTPVAMPGKLLLYVEPRPNSKGFVLMHFAYDIDDSGPQQFEPVENEP
jgi:hypothetical protein